MPSQNITCAANLLLALMVTLIGIGLAQAQKSPCPDVFQYLIDSANQIFGYIEIDNIRMGQTVVLSVQLSITALLPQSNSGSIQLLQSQDVTLNRIKHGNPVQFRVNLPLQHILPHVVNIALNGRTICTGRAAQGNGITTINLQHKLSTSGSSVGPFSGFDLDDHFGNNGFSFNDNDFDDNIGFRIRPQQQRPQGIIIERTTMRPIIVQPVTTTRRPVPMRTTITAPTNTACGKPFSNGIKDLSFNGERVSKGQFPWIVPLFYEEAQSHKPEYVCGSTIISSKHLITAAHCIYNADEIMKADRILAAPGMYNIDNFADDNVRIAYIASVHQHSDYVSSDDQNDADIAILRLKKVLTYTAYILPICMWNGVNSLNEVVNAEGSVAGWGWTEAGPSAVPTFIKASIVSHKSCQDNLQNVFRVSSRVFCGDGHGSTPCNGDSGNGFALKRGNQFYLRGIVSKGQLDPNTQLCDVTKYTIFTDVAPHRYWIKKVMDLNP